jgi:hypothetical protein
MWWCRRKEPKRNEGRGCERVQDVDWWDLQSKQVSGIVRSERGGPRFRRPNVERRGDAQRTLKVARVRDNGGELLELLEGVGHGLRAVGACERGTTSGGGIDSVCRTATGRTAAGVAWSWSVCSHSGGATRSLRLTVCVLWRWENGDALIPRPKNASALLLSLWTKLFTLESVTNSTNSEIPLEDQPTQQEGVYFRREWPGRLVSCCAARNNAGRASDGQRRQRVSRGAPLRLR